MHEPPTASDLLQIERQLGRRPRAIESVAVRCPYGIPAVTRQKPIDDEGHPFPTLYYLTCPHLVREIDRIESTGAIDAAQQQIDTDPDAAAVLRATQLRHGEMTGHDRGIAGVHRLDRVKCLHAHAAFALAEGDHAVGETALDATPSRWCEDARCSQPSE